MLNLFGAQNSKQARKNRNAKQKKKNCSLFSSGYTHLEANISRRSGEAAEGGADPLQDPHREGSRHEGEARTQCCHHGKPRIRRRSPRQRRRQARQRQR